MENVLISYFKVESEAYQALSQMKKLAGNEDLLVLSQVGVFKKQYNEIRMADAFDTGKVSSNDTLIGTLVGGLAGILAGPLGLLLGLGIGGTVGLLTDAKDMKRESGLLNRVTKQMENGDVALIAVVQEHDEDPIDRLLAQFDTKTERYDASAVQEEVDHAKDVQEELEHHANERMAEDRSDQRKERVEDYKHKFQNDFQKLKDRLSKD